MKGQDCHFKGASPKQTPRMGWASHLSMNDEQDETVSKLGTRTEDVPGEVWAVREPPIRQEFPQRRF